MAKSNRPDPNTVKQAFKSIEEVIILPSALDKILKETSKSAGRFLLAGMFVTVFTAFERFILDTMDEPDKKLTFYFLNPMAKGDSTGQGEFWAYLRIKEAIANESGRFEKSDVKWDNPKSPVSPVLLDWGINKKTDLFSNDFKDKDLKKLLSGLVNFIQVRITAYKSHWKENKELPYWK